MDNKENLNEKLLVVKGNPLIQAQIDDLSSTEYKLLVTAISKITPSDKVLNKISFTANDFCLLIKVNKVGMYSHIKKSCDKLLKRTITIYTDKKNWIKFPWINRIQYKDGTIMINFHSDLEPYLLFCKENKEYTKYFLENVIDMDSKYSIRMYELLKQYNKLGYRIFELNELKKFLGIPLTKYEKFNNLKRKVLNVSKNEINGLTDINVDFEEIKENRKVIKIKFLISSKNYKMNTSQYELFPKLKLISILNKKIHNKTGHLFNFKDLNKYHRIVIIELIKKLDNNSFKNVLIRYPNAFFKWHLDDITKMYDLNKLKDY